MGDRLAPESVIGLGRNMQWSLEVLLSAANVPLCVVSRKERRDADTTPTPSTPSEWLTALV